MPMFPPPEKRIMVHLTSMLNKIFEGDCLEIMERMPENSIDMILCDLPYGTTNNKWDSVLPFDNLWQNYERLIKPSGVIVLTAAQPFSSALVMSNPKLFKYEWIWEKTIASGQLNVNRQPLRAHESILVFYKRQPTYNQQLEKGTPYSINRKADFEGPGYNKQVATSKINTGYRHPKSVLKFPNPRVPSGHPTQKPVELFKYLIKTYTDPGEIVLDNCIGSGTTAEAALETGRQFIGIEIEAKYASMARNRVRQVKENGRQELYN